MSANVKPHPQYDPEQCLEHGCHNVAMRRRLCLKRYRERQAEAPDTVPPAKPIVGGSQPGRRAWTAEEIGYLEESWGKVKPQTIARRLDRSYLAIKLKARRLGLRLAGDGYTARQIEGLLGLSDKTIVHQWGTHGLRIVRHQIGSLNGSPRPCSIQPEDVRKFLIAHPEAYNWERLDDLTRRQLGIEDMPVRPVAKVVECRRCEQEYRVRLDDHHPRCYQCQSVMSGWAKGYADKIQIRYPDRAPTLDECEYYDPATDRLQCLHCKQWFKSITGLHVQQHGYRDLAHYREHFGLHPRSPNHSRGVVALMGPKITRNWGKYRGDPPRPAYRRTGYRRPWTDAEREWLRDNWYRPLPELAAHLGRKRKQVRNYARTFMGLLRSGVHA